MKQLPMEQQWSRHYTAFTDIPEIIKNVKSLQEKALWDHRSKKA